MGTNFHTAWTTSTEFCTDDMNGVPSTLDRAVTYLKNIIVHFDGNVTYSILTGSLTWDDDIRIIFNTADGVVVENYIAASNVTLTDAKMAYVDLNETDGTALTMNTATITMDAASNTITYNRLVLGYRNTASDNFFSVYLDVNPDHRTQAPSSGDTVSIDWSLGSLAMVDLDRATTTFSFDGARDGQVVYLAMVQDSTGGRAASFGSEARGGTDISLPLTLSATGDLTDYATFIYNGGDSKYDIIGFVKGY